MEDAIRPGEQATRAMFERGYRTWSRLCELASQDSALPMSCLSRVEAAFPNHPYFPENLHVDTFSNAAVTRGKTTWTVGDEHLPSFQDEVLFEVAWKEKTRVLLTSDPRRSTTVLPDIFGTDTNHIPILMLAWAYVLSARWAELIPGACISQTNQDTSNGSGLSETDKPVVSVNLGQVEESAINWWKSILTEENGWDANICSSKGVLHSPWTVKLASEQRFVVTDSPTTPNSAAKHTLVSSTTSLRYLSDYCDLHNIHDQSRAALAAALSIPLAKYDNRQIELAIPTLLGKSDRKDNGPRISLLAIEANHQLDRLLTLSCNPRGLKALLDSIFFEPDVETNICGIWLQGSFAFLDALQDPHQLLRAVMKRDPELGFLWLGAFLTGAHNRCLREARGAWWPVDLSSAAWTGTFASFIQAPVLLDTVNRGKISRADECRLLYLSHGIDYTTPPLFPFPPFGYTVIEDTNLDVREHALCGMHHGLEYLCFTWSCKDGKELQQQYHDGVKSAALRPKNGQISSDNDHIINNHDDLDYEDLDSEDENSEAVTRNIFTWLRGEDGFPVAERPIREHEWIDNLDSDDDSPIEGDVRSTVGGNLHGWIARVSTQRSNSI
ncbi:hypothetical protein CDV31_012708 [Fusarium ambrosium]|uniref:Uncharacterized protein n=1 Tax=Fusarium ambrosium TaxID=131363 RepID=A0A428T841_9HYPO|nr:hypothetical protein CDV31_012708 [Fusarium ambrosium]